MSWTVVAQICLIVAVSGMIANLVGESLIKTWQKRDIK